MRLEAASVVIILLVLKMRICLRIDLLIFVIAISSFEWDIDLLISKL